MIRQQPLTIVSPVKPASYSNLDAVLKQLRADLEQGIATAVSEYRYHSLFPPGVA